jgi:hypothetical protein
MADKMVGPSVASMELLMADYLVVQLDSNWAVRSVVAMVDQMAVDLVDSMAVP